MKTFTRWLIPVILALMLPVVATAQEIHVPTVQGYDVYRSGVLVERHVATAGGGETVTIIAGVLLPSTNPTAGQCLQATGTGFATVWGSCGGVSTGDVVGPASAVNNDLAAFDLTTGKLIKDSGVLTSNVVTLTGSQALSNKTLTTPTIASFTNATHGHTNAAGGGTLAEGALALTNVTIGNVSTSAHGFAPIAPNDATKFLDGTGVFSTPASGGSPGGSNTQVQFNNSSAFGGVSTFTWVSPVMAAPSVALGASPSTSTVGILYRGTVSAGNRFLHDYDSGAGPGYELYLGLGAGNFTSASANKEDTGIGYGALAAVTSGASNTCVGAFCLNTLTNGVQNTVMGTEAGSLCTSCNQTTLMGANAGHVLTAGISTAIGAGTMQVASDGHFNTAIGNNAMHNVTSGAENTAVGDNALPAITVSFDNTAIGQHALGSLASATTFGSNTSLGASSLFQATDVLRAVAVGYEAGSPDSPAGAASLTDTDMVLIGFKANRGNVTNATYTDYIVIGSSAVGGNPTNPSHTATLGTTTTTQTYLYGTLITAGPALAVANVGANSCGTTAATVTGNDNAGDIVVGATAGTQCRVTFAFAAPTRRDCVVSDDTTTIATRAAYVDSTHSDFFGTFTAGDTLSFICVAR